ncbi:hypothetical protein SAMN04487864_11518 [Succiniclasticum ruminis]|uniref:Uncharacterized protein n=1 Tax=Succiniclasticum ruminis TaxID=40841 RepID=A0A1G6NQ17_9FIRM|nr:hypothetical protein [Succiniclasticum ruminis]SDC69396.1 hypothetical protein SAMN04487864_11518 [Succiniclasticum ruminis]
MRSPIFKRPTDDIHITRLATGKAVVRMYAAYIENPMKHGTVFTTANVVETVVYDRPDLEAHVLRHWKFYYDKAVQDEIKYLSALYGKVIREAQSTQPPGKKRDIEERANNYIRQIANGDTPFLIQQDFAKYLKQHI